MDDVTTTPPPMADDPAVVVRPERAPERAFGVRTIATTYVSGFLMGSADLVPGVSGGTIALVLGIYERLVADVRQGARALGLLVRGDLRDALRALGHVGWSFMVPLVLGILTAVAVLASTLDHLLETQPVALAGAFSGLIVGSTIVAYGELEDRSGRIHAILAGAAIVTFLLLGMRTGRFEDPGLLVVLAGGALAICAMILPGVSGSFILLMIGLYEFVIGAVDDRDLVVLAVFALGTVIGLGSFSTLLNWLLVRFREVVLAVLIGLMVGSLRVLWPWPAGPDGVGDTTLGAPVWSEVPMVGGLAALGLVAVVLIARTARALSTADD